MAIQPKKKRKATTSKRRSVRKKRQKKSTIKRTVFISILSISLLGFMLAEYYFLVYKNNTPVFNQKKSAYSAKKLLEDLAKIKIKKIEHTKPMTTRVVHKKNSVAKPLFEERGEAKEKEHQVSKNNISLAYRGKRPKLAIIIDDVHTKKQISEINHLGLKITPSIFPPYVLAKHSNLLAKNLKHYMIHLPMESSSKQFNTQGKTLLTSFSDEQIADRVMEIRQLFPKAKYMNNHTGSVFTSNYKAMKKLYIALKMEGFIFVDSFTVPTSKVRQIAHEFGDAYVRRDIFIDNKHNQHYIHKQLQMAVQKAKKNGYAIAIGHPHKTTMQALASAKQILKDVELVYIDDIYRRK